MIDDQAVMDGTCFAAGHAVGAISGQHSMLQIVNPSESGKVVLVDLIEAVGSYTAKWSLQAYSTLISSNEPVTCNSRFGFGPCTAQVRYGGNASLLGSQHAIFWREANDPLRLEIPGRPLVQLDEGYGLIVACHVQTAFACINIDWREIAAS